MRKVLAFFKRLLGVKKYIQFAILLANVIHIVNRDLNIINNGGKIKMIDEDKDGVHDLFDRDTNEKK